MSQRISTIASRSWAVRLLLVGMLAMCALMMRAPHGAAAAMGPAGHQAVAGQGITGTEITGETAVSLSASTHAGIAAYNQAQNQRGDGCFCCPTPLDIAAACATVDSGPPQQHGTLPRALDEDAFVTPDLVSSGSAAQRAAPPPSLAELSLLRI